jgi:uncharacterized membrane protein
MKHKEFLSQLDEAKIVQAIGDAERKSSGEIRVLVSRRQVEDALATAQREFVHFGMAKTRQRNGVLLYFAPLSQRFAIVGDTGVHERCGDAFWQEITTSMSGLLRKGEFTGAVLLAIQKVGDLLARHFPHEPDDQNELPDQIVRD